MFKKEDVVSLIIEDSDELPVIGKYSRSTLKNCGCNTGGEGGRQNGGPGEKGGRSGGTSFPNVASFWRFSYIRIISYPPRS